MQSFFVSLSNLISNIWYYIKQMFEAFFSLLDYVYDSVKFVLDASMKLPDVVRIPCTIILGVMVIKFILSFGKQ